MYILEIFVDPSLSDSVRTYYEKYNNKNAGDSGIDLLNVSEINVRPFEQVTLNFGIKCQMTHLNTETGTTELSGYYLYPRSSISKTPLVLKNSVGIIDSGYRGNIMAKVQNIPKVIYPENNNEESSILEVLGNAMSYKIEEDSRLFQICSPTLEPIVVKVVDSLEGLSRSSRGEGGFGSTDALSVEV